MQKVLITHDFITSKNFDFIPRILFFIKKILSTFGVKVYFGDNLFDQNFQRKFCSLNQVNSSQEGKFFLKQFSPNQDSLDYLKSFLDSFDLIIGYEFSEITKESINSLQIRYIDIWLSPIRFLNDLNFCLHSNDENINKKLSKVRLNSNKIFEKANQIIENRQIDKPEKTSSDLGANLIVTQSLEDKSLVKDSKYLKLTDFKKEIVKICKSFSRNYILKHPNLTDTQFLRLVEDLDITDLEIIKGNTYEIMSSKNLNHLTSISSSLLEEAKYFGKDTTYLFQPVIDHRYICINESIYKASFWQDILDSSVTSSYTFIHHDNYLRNLFGSAWGYHSFLRSETNMFEYNSVVSFLNFLGSLDKSKEYFLYGTGSISKFVIENTDMKIVGVITRHKKQKEFFGIPVHEIDQIKGDKTVIITPFYDFERIKKSFRKNQNGNKLKFKSHINDSSS